MRLLMRVSSLLLLGCSSAFVVKRQNVSTRRIARGVGGPGWDNNSFLDGLGGGSDQEDVHKAEYEQFKETREAFAKRQQERMNTEAGQKFMKQQQERPQEMMDEDEMMVDEAQGASIGDRGPSRFKNMMEQAKKKNMSAGRGQPTRAPEWMRGPPGLQQKLAIPLDDDEQEEEDGNEE